MLQIIDKMSVKLFINSGVFLAYFKLF